MQRVNEEIINWKFKKRILFWYVGKMTVTSRYEQVKTIVTKEEPFWVLVYKLAGEKLYKWNIHLTNEIRTDVSPHCR